MIMGKDKVRGVVIGMRKESNNSILGLQDLRFIKHKLSFQIKKQETWLLTPKVNILIKLLFD